MYMDMLHLLSKGLKVAIVQEDVVVAHVAVVVVAAYKLYNHLIYLTILSYIPSTITRQSLYKNGFFHSKMYF